MNNTDKTHDRAQAAERVALTVQGAIRHLVQIEGVPLDVALSIAHGVVMAEIAASFGGDVAADCAQRAADRVAGWPAIVDGELAAMQPKGRA